MSALQPKDEGRKATADQIIDRPRPKLDSWSGRKTFLQAPQDINVGGRAGQAQYQYTLSDADLDELNTWTPKLLAALPHLPQLKDVSSDQQSQARGRQPDHRPRRRRAASASLRPTSTPPSTT